MNKKPVLLLVPLLLNLKELEIQERSSYLPFLSSYNDDKKKSSAFRVHSLEHFAVWNIPSKAKLWFNFLVSTVISSCWGLFWAVLIFATWISQTSLRIYERRKEVSLGVEMMRERWITLFLVMPRWSCNFLPPDKVAN